MNRLLFHPFSFVALLCVVVAGAWFSYLPIYISSHLLAEIEKRVGRPMQAPGGAGYVFSPRFGIQLFDVQMAGASALAEPVIKAGKLIVPLNFTQILVGRADANNFILEDAAITVQINAQGHANVLIEQEPELAKTDIDAKDEKPVSVELGNSRFVFHDERNNSGFAVDKISGLVQLFADGGLGADVSAVLNNQFVTVHSSVGSVARVFSDGSPLDLNVDGAGVSVAFAGRISTIGSLNLAGQADVSSTDLPRALRWMGNDIKGLAAVKTMSLSGALQSDGPTFDFKNAILQFADMHGKGDVSLSAGAERPSLKAELGFDHINLDLYAQPAASPSTEGWREKPLDFSDLAAFDAELTLSSNKVIYNGQAIGASKLAASLHDRALRVSLKSEAMTGGSGDIDVDLDTKQLPAKLKLSLNLIGTEAKSVLNALFGVRFLSGNMALSAQLSSTGVSPAELISSLTGQTKINLNNGTVATVDVAGLLKSAPAAEWLPGTTENVKLDADVEFTNGVASLKTAEFNTSDVRARVEGEVDLLRGAINIIVDGKTKIFGPWQKPVTTAVVLAKK